MLREVNALPSTQPRIIFVLHLLLQRLECYCLLHNSKPAQIFNVKKMAQSAIGNDEEGYRKEFIQLVKSAASLKEKETARLETDEKDDQ
jgi:hypothetical protein